MIHSGSAALTAQGQRTASGVIAADFAATGLDLLRFHQFLDPYADVTGTASFSGHFSGTPQSPHVVLTALDVPNLVVNRQTFAPLTLAGRYDDGVLTQTGAPWRFVVQVPTDYAAEAGGQVEYDVDALRLTLPSASQPNRPQSLILSAAIPQSAPERLSHVFATVRSSPWARSAAGQKFLAQLANLPQPIAGTFALPRLEVSGPLQALQVEANLSAGNLLFGEAKVGGLTANLGYEAGKQPSGHVSAEAKDLLAAGVPIGALTADADYRNRVVTVHHFRATSARAFLNASGTANLDGDIAASVDASNIPLAFLGTVLPAAAPAFFNPPDVDSKRLRQAALDTALGALPREISALSVVASGPTRAPNLVGSVSLANPDTAPANGLGGQAGPSYALDRIRTGAITLAPATPGGPRVLTVSDLAAFKNGHLVATLSGSLPVPLGDLTKPDAAGQTTGDQDDLHADLKVQDLAALAGFSPGLLDPKKTGGQLAASANFGGGQLSGLVTLTDASVGLTSFDTSVNKINGIVVLGDNKARIQSFTGQSSKGGTFALSGSGELALKGNSDFRLTTRDLTLEENSRQNVLAEKFSSSLRAKINGALTMSGPWLTPSIATPAGAPIVVSDANGILPTPSNAKVTPSEPSKFDPSFDVAVQLGGGRSKTVSVRNLLLRADGQGTVHLGGHLANPVLQARLSVTRGQFILPPSTLLKIVKPVGGDANTVDVLYSAETGEGDLAGTANAGEFDGPGDGFALCGQSGAGPVGGRKQHW